MFLEPPGTRFSTVAFNVGFAAVARFARLAGLADQHVDVGVAQELQRIEARLVVGRLRLAERSARGGGEVAVRLQPRRDRTTIAPRRVGGRGGDEREGEAQREDDQPEEPGNTGVGLSGRRRSP